MEGQIKRGQTQIRTCIRRWKRFGLRPSEQTAFKLLLDQDQIRKATMEEIWLVRLTLARRPAGSRWTPGRQRDSLQIVMAVAKHLRNFIKKCSI